MTDLPDAVPHSKKQLTVKDEKKQEESITSHYGGGIDIVKNDNGTCILKEHLTSAGMEGMTALSMFKCGQTKMEKAYDVQMNKVLKKLGKK